MGKSGNPAVRAQQDAAPPEAREYDPTPVDADGIEDFDAFWQSQDREHITIRVMGENIDLPPAMPLEVELLAKRLQRKSDPRSVRRMITALFGEDRTTKWAEAGMDAEQFQVLLAYAMHRIGGGDRSMSEVRDLIRDREASGEA